MGHTKHLLIPKYVNAALATGEKEEISVVVPANLVHFKLELFLGTRLVRLHVNECHEVFLVADGNRLTIGRPTHVDVLSYNSRLTSSPSQCDFRFDLFFSFSFPVIFSFSFILQYFFVLVLVLPTTKEYQTC